MVPTTFEALIHEVIGIDNGEYVILLKRAFHYRYHRASKREKGGYGALKT